MRILWFCNTPSGFRSTGRKPAGGGWISSLEEHVRQVAGLDLGIAFFDADPRFKVEQNGVTYYPMRRNLSFAARVDRFFRYASQDERELALCRRVIADFKPDVIHVFGTESSFGLLARETPVPLVVHLQGLMTPYLNAWVPPGYSIRDYKLSTGLNPLRVALRARSLGFNRHAARREMEIMRSCRNFMGRTDWDSAYCRLFAPNARYFHCEEMLRREFQNPEATWSPPSGHVISSVLSNPLYKGHDLILKTAKVLRDAGCRDFKWNVYGVRGIRFAEKKTGIAAEDVNVEIRGVATASELRDALLGSSVFVHPSYIDNSPNSVCEAQVLGVPTVATHVGGVSSLFPPEMRADLVPANDPFALADRIRSVFRDPSRAIVPIGFARARHDPKLLVGRLLRIYERVESGTGDLE